MFYGILSSLLLCFNVFLFNGFFVVVYSTYCHFGFNEIIERLRIFNGLFVDSSHDIYRWKSAMPIQMCQLHESSGISDTTCITSCLLEEG